MNQISLYLQCDCIIVLLSSIGSGAKVSLAGGLCERPAGVTVCCSLCGQSLGIKSAECGNHAIFSTNLAVRCYVWASFENTWT